MRVREAEITVEGQPRPLPSYTAATHVCTMGAEGVGTAFRLSVGACGSVSFVCACAITASLLALATHTHIHTYMRVRVPMLALVCKDT